MIANVSDRLPTSSEYGVVGVPMGVVVSGVELLHNI